MSVDSDQQCQSGQPGSSMSSTQPPEQRFCIVVVSWEFPATNYLEHCRIKWTFLNLYLQVLSWKSQLLIFWKFKNNWVEISWREKYKLRVKYFLFQLMSGNFNLSVPIKNHIFWHTWENLISLIRRLKSYWWHLEIFFKW